MHGQQPGSGEGPHLGRSVVAAGSGPAHAARPPTAAGRRPVRAAVLGTAGSLILLTAGAAWLARPADDAISTATSARTITAAPRIPLSAAELVALTGRDAELGALADSRRRAACLADVGHPGAAGVLGARELTVAGRAAIVLVLAGARPGELVAVAVEPDCGDKRGTAVARTTVPANPTTPS